MSARARDTSEAAHRVQTEVWQRLGGTGRLSLAASLSEDVVEVARLGIAQRHPTYSAEQVRFAALRSRLGDALFRRAYPDAPLLDP